MYTYTYTQPRIYIHTCIHTWAHSHIHSHANSCTHTLSIYMHAYVHIYSHSATHKCGTEVHLQHVKSFRSSSNGHVLLVTVLFSLLQGQCILGLLAGHLPKFLSSRNKRDSQGLSMRIDKLTPARSEPFKEGPPKIHGCWGRIPCISKQSEGPDMREKGRTLWFSLEQLLWMI